MRMPLPEAINSMSRISPMTSKCIGQDYHIHGNDRQVQGHISARSNCTAAALTEPSRSQ